jgi:hypothetical protein
METYFEDLSPCLYVGGFLGETPEKFKAVGWLATGRPYPMRQTPIRDPHFRQLLTLLVHPWQPGYFLGSHECRFCLPPSPPILQGQKSKSQIMSRKCVDGVEIVVVQNAWGDAFERRHRLERYGLVISFGASNVFVPGEGVIYVAPSMIAHYIDAHNYEPPAVFWEAVMKCPEMGSDAYGQALILNGPSNEEWKRMVWQRRLERLTRAAEERELPRTVAPEPEKQRSWLRRFFGFARW